MYVTLYNSICFAGALATLLVGVVVVLYRGKQPVHSRFLALSLFSFGYILIAFLLLETRLILSVPHLYRTGSIAGFVFWPAIYLYVRLAVQPGSLRWRDGLHALPMLVYLLDFAPFFSLPAAEKISLLAGRSYSQIVADLNEGWFFPTLAYPPIRLGLIGFYLSGQVYLIYHWYKANRQKNTSWVQTWLQWFALLTIAQLTLAVTSVALVTSVPGGPSYNTLTATIGVMGVLLTVMLLVRPEILYGLERSGLLANRKPPAQPVGRPLLKLPELTSGTDPLADNLHQQLTKLMQTQQPFLKVGYSLPDMATDAGVPVHQLSNYINSRYGMNFNEYINQYRIEHFKERLQQHDWNHKTLEALAMESGFSNRFTFTNAFKRMTGTTPSDYLRALRQAS